MRTGSAKTGGERAEHFGRFHSAATARTFQPPQDKRVGLESRLAHRGASDLAKDGQTVLRGGKDAICARYDALP